ncbi:alginate export family protein [Thermodesulfovibrionales bacterium]|nr:alginate export family protein [Thermodesulfovibrionales bacterium]
MRKYLASILGFLLVFSAVGFMKIAPAEASVVESLRGADIRLGGDIRIRHQYLDNVDGDDLPRDVPGGSEFNQRVRLDLRIDVGDGVTGRILTELTDGNVLWGVDKFRGDVRTRQAWIAKEFGRDFGFKAGLKPVKIGEGLFFDTEATGISLWAEPAAGTTITLLYANLREEEKDVIDTHDVNLYSIMAEHTIPMGGDLTLGANYTLWTSDVGAKTIDIYRPDPMKDVRVDDKLNLSNFGLTVAGEFGCLVLGATADFQFGNAGDEVDFKGTAFTANVEYCLGVADVRAGFGIGSGPEDDEVTENEFNMFHAVAPDDLLFIYDDIVMSAAGDTGMGIANTTFFTVGASFEPTDTKEAGVDIHFLRATESWPGTTVGNLGHDDAIGTEVKGEFEWQITRGLTYTLQAGILFAGDFYKDNGVEPENVVAVDNALVLSF